MQIKLRKVISTVLTLMLVFGLFVGMPGAANAATGEGGGSPTASITVNGGLDAEAIVNQLLGKDVTVRNVKYTGDKSALGNMQGGKTIIGIEEGIVLSTGSLIGAKNILTGPNDSSSFLADSNGGSDSDLGALIGSSSTKDAAVLEFEFMTGTDKLYFEYIFGSEEYNEYVNSSFNDVFGFFLDGVNVALLPDTDTPVSINTVNNGEDGKDGAAIGGGVNSAYFIDNCGINNKRNTQLDGFTTVLPVKADLTPGKWHHIKLAIADVSDESHDSAVVIKAGSFAGTPPVEPNVPVKHRYYKSGVLQAETDGWFYAEGDTALSGSLFQKYYDGNTYSVRDIKVITYGYVVKEQVEYTVVPWTWDGVYCEQESYTGTADEGTLMDQAFFELNHPWEGYVIDYVEPDGELLSKDAENVFNVYYKLAEEEPEEATPAVLMIEEPASEEPVIEEPASEEPVLEDQKSDFDPGKLTASLDSDIQSLLGDPDPDPDSELVFIKEEPFKEGDTKEFSDNYQYEIIVTYDYNEPIKSGGPNRGSRTTGTVVADPVVPLADTPVLDPVQAVVAETDIPLVDVPLADVPQTGAVVGFSLAAICGLAGLGTTLLGGRAFMGRRRMK